MMKDIKACLPFLGKCLVIVAIFALGVGLQCIVEDQIHQVHCSHVVTYEELKQHDRSIGYERHDYNEKNYVDYTTSSD